MKILYLHQHFSTPKGAVGNRSYHMAQKLIERGHSVTMVCGSYQNGETGLSAEFRRGIRSGIVSGIEIIECDLSYSNADGFLRRSLTFLRYMQRSIRLAFTQDYDVIFATTTPLTVAVPGILARWLRRKPFVFEVRDLWPELPKAMGVIRNRLVLGMLLALEWCGYKSANKVIGLAPGIVEGVQRFGIPDDRVALVPNGCDLDVFDVDRADARPCGIKDIDLLAVYAGTHGIANGLHNILRVAAELKKRGRGDIALVLVGSGKEKPALVAEAAKANLENVHFLDPMPKHKLASLFKGADIGIQALANVPAFYFGTSPNKFFDYIAAGLPVVTNYPGWIAEMIHSERIGFAVAPDDPSAFADALETAQANRAELLKMGKRSREFAAREFDRSELAERFVDCLESAARE